MTADVLTAMDGTPSHMKMPSASKLRPSPAIPGSMEAAIKMWLQVGNVQKLQQVGDEFNSELFCAKIAQYYNDIYRINLNSNCKNFITP